MNSDVSLNSRNSISVAESTHESATHAGTQNDGEKADAENHEHGRFCVLGRTHIKRDCRIVSLYDDSSRHAGAEFLARVIGVVPRRVDVVGGKPRAVVRPLEIAQKRRSLAVNFLTNVALFAATATAATFVVVVFVANRCTARHAGHRARNSVVLVALDYAAGQ